MPTETEAPAITDKPPKRLRGTSSKAGRRLSHQILRDIHRDITNTTRQPTSRLRFSSPTASKQPNQLQPLQKRRGSTPHPHGSSSTTGAKKGRSRDATLGPPTSLHKETSAPQYSCLSEKEYLHTTLDHPLLEIPSKFNIYVNPSPVEGIANDGIPRPLSVNTDDFVHIDYLSPMTQTPFPEVTVKKREQFQYQRDQFSPNHPQCHSIGLISGKHNKVSKIWAFKETILEAQKHAHTTKCQNYCTTKCCWEGRALKQFFLSLVIDHWIGEVIKWTAGEGQATPGVRCPQHRVGLCPVTLKRFRRQPFSQRQGKQLE